MAGNWRGGSNSHPPRKTASPGTPQAKLAPIGWRRHSGKEIASASNRVWLRRLGGIFAILILVGALIGLYLLLKPVRSQLVVDFGRYDSDLAVPGRAAGLTAEELAAALPNLTVAALRTDNSDILNSRSDATIVFVDSVMLSGANGPFLADDLSRPDETNLREQPLTGVGNRPKSAAQWLEPILARAETRPTLLVLDLSQPRVNWRSGVLAPFAAFEFLEGLLSNVERRTKEVPSTRLAVLVSCRPGEQAWSDRGHSRFSRSVVEALRGAADGANDGKTDGRVTAAELGRYVCDDVQNWVSSHRWEDGQHPVWMMFGKDFDVAYASDGRAPWPAAPTGGTLVLDELEKAWQRRDAVWNDDPSSSAYLQAPLDWRRANHLLLQAEAYYRAGQFAQAKRLLADAGESLERLAVSDQPTFDPPMAASAQLASFEPSRPTSVAATELSECVDVRSTAHQAATSSPRALGLVRTTLLQADAARREAEDALFLGQSQTLRARRRDASEQYQKCLEAGERYDRACRSLDRLLAGLPYLADWAAAQTINDRVIDAFAVTPSENGDVDLQTQGVDLVASLLVETRSLRQAIGKLEGPSLPLEDASRQLAVVASQAEDAVKRMSELERTLRNDAKELLNSTEKTGGRRLIRRRQLDQYLSNCLLDGGVRRQILEKLAQLDDGLDVSAVGSSEDGPDVRESRRPASYEWQPDEASQHLARLAAWQGLWALLVRSLDPLAESEHERLWKDNWAIVAGQARLDEAQRPSDAETARKTASSLGDLLRIGWRASAAEASRSRSYSGDAEQITRELIERDRIARCLQGFDADALVRSRRRDPARDLIAWNRSQLSLYLAKQSLSDFYAGQAGSSHWFEDACRFHLDSANKAARGVAAISTAISTDVAATQELLSRRRSSRFWLQTDRVTFGSYDQRPGLLTVSMEGDAPAGSAAVWLDAPSQGEAVQLGSPERREVRIDAMNEVQNSNVSIDLVRKAASCNLVSLPVRWFYRGHVNSEARALEADPCPPGRRVAVAMPQPEQGVVVVSGADRRSILFVLDCSLSMSETLPDGTSKMNAAISILRSINDDRLGRPNSTPRRMGLIAFGHRMNRDRTRNNELWPNPNWPANDRPVDPLVDYQALVPLADVAAIDPAKFSNELDRLDPWGMTPLVNSIRFAVRQFDPNEVGTLVVITDGADSVLEQGNENQKATTRAVLSGISTTLAGRKARGVPVEVHIVGFALNKTAEGLLKEVFEAVATPSGGRQFKAADRQKLANFLENAVQPRQYSVVAAGRNEGSSFELDAASNPLSRGEYRLSFPDAAPAAVTISGGERIVFDLRDGRLTPRKYQKGSPASLVARASDAPSTPDAPDVLVDRGYQINSGQATVTVSLDRAAAGSDPPRTTSEGFVERPKEVWFEATDSTGRRTTALTWEIAEQHDIPTWKLSLPAPSDQKLNITAHWKMNATSPQVGMILSREDIGKEVAISTNAGTASMVLKSLAKDDGRPGVVVARFEPAGGEPPADDVRALLENSWAQMDSGPPGAGEFRPIEMQTERTFFYDEGAIEFAFSVGPDFDATSARVGLIAPDALENGDAVATIQYAKAD